MVVAGEKCTLNCRTTTKERLSWYHVGHNGQSFTVYNGYFVTYSVNSSYDIDSPAAGAFNLAIISANLNLSGSYRCQESGSLESAASELVVLGDYLFFFIMD